MNRIEARSIAVLSIVAAVLLLVITCLLLFRPSSLFPFYSPVDVATASYIQARHDKLVDKPLFVLSGGILLSQVMAITLLLIPFARETLAGFRGADGPVPRRASTIPSLQVASLTTCLTGIAITLSGSILVTWDGRKGGSSSALITLGLLVVLCSALAGLSTLMIAPRHDTDSIDPKSTSAARRQSASATSATWRVSDVHGTPQSRLQKTVIQTEAQQHHQSLSTITVTPRTLRKQQLSPTSIRLALEQGSEPRPPLHPGRASIDEADKPTELPPAGAFRIVLPMVAPQQPPMPALPIPVCSSSRPSSGIMTWEDGYQRLVGFHKKHGQSHVLHGALAEWLDKQRGHYKMLVEELVRPEDCELNSDRIDLLNSLSVDWSYNEVAEWEDRYGELQAHFDTYGSIGMAVSSFPANDGSPSSSRQAVYPVEKDVLLKWMRQQQDEYALWKAKEPTSMTIERILKLQALGFVWDKSALLHRMPSEVFVEDGVDTISALV